MRNQLAAGIILVSLAVGCGDDGPTFVDAGAVDAADDAATDAPPCPARWTVRANPGASATVGAGALILSASNVAVGSALEVYQVGLTGDFDVRFFVQSFGAGGTGAFLQAAVSADLAQAPQLLTAAFGTSPVTGISAADQPSGTSQIQVTALTTGELRFGRAGTIVTIRAITTGPTATTTATFATSPLRVGVQLGSNLGTVAPTTTARLSQFQVVAGTGVTTDTFDCNSLSP